MGVASGLHILKPFLNRPYDHHDGEQDKDLGFVRRITGESVSVAFRYCIPPGFLERLIMLLDIGRTAYLSSADQV
jgi:hypothetical protein